MFAGTNGVSGVNFHQRRMILQLKAVSKAGVVPDDGASPQQGQMVQGDSGADVHMFNSPEWCALGMCTEMHFYAGTAKESDPVVKMDAVAPLIVAMDGYGDDVNKIVTLRYLGPMVLAWGDEWSKLLSRNDIERDGLDGALLDNEVFTKQSKIVFDQSCDEMRVSVPMTRFGRGNFVLMRVPTAEEIQRFLRVKMTLDG
jgi:hypothetical protein